MNNITPKDTLSLIESVLSKENYNKGGVVNIDPVSGNEVPAGALPKEVRDDVPINASEGEYVIPANVVRYLGLDRIEKLVQKAQQGMEEMQANGRIGGEPSGGVAEQGVDEDLPFSPEELVALEDEANFNKGGAVTDEAQSSLRIYELPNGQLVYIPMLGGDPLVDVPAGAKEVSMGGASPSMDKGRDEAPDFNISPLAKDPSEWSVQDFTTYKNIQDRRASGDFGQKVEDKFVSTLTNMTPFGSLGAKAREKYLSNAVPDQIDTMLESKVDAQGNPLSEEDMVMLSETRKAMTESKQAEGNKKPVVDSLGEAIAKSLGPIGVIGKEVVDRLSGSIAAKPSTPSGGGRDDDPFSYTGTTRKEREGKDDLVTPTAENFGELSSGGLYKKGGLVSRRKK